MIVLALDTALDAAQAAILRGETLLARACRPMRAGQAEVLLPMVEELLARAGLAYADIDRVAVTIGPGSFAGVRIGLAAARGLGLALSRPVVGVTTLAAMASLGAGRGQPILVAIDARREEAYAQRFTADGAPTSEAGAFPFDDVGARLTPETLVVASPTLVGRIAVPPGAGVVVAEPFVPIEAVARLGAAAARPGGPPAPLYLRAPDAKPQAAPIARRA